MDQTTFADVLQKSFIAMSMGGTDRITTLNILLNLSMSFMIGLFIFYVYKKAYQGVLYQRSFNISLVIACAVTSLVIMTISGNLILSLGMVGALSIVRFRTPVKDSMDLIFLFWAISAGIANGVGYFNISIVGSILIAVFILLLTRSGKTRAESFLLVIQMPEGADETPVIDYIHSAAERVAMKSKTISDHAIEMTLEVKVSEASESEFVKQLYSKGDINRATLVAYDQDLASV